MGADRPVVNGGTRRDRFDVDEIERLLIRRIAVEMEQRQAGRGQHTSQFRRARTQGERGAGYQPSRPEKGAPKERSPAVAGLPKSLASAITFAAAVTGLLGLLAGLLLPALLLLTRL